MKKKALILVTICLILVSSVNVFAWTKQRAQCPDCKKYNYSFAIDEKTRHTYTFVKSGYYCDGCSKVVPKNEEHSFDSTYDMHYFICQNHTSFKTYQDYFFNSNSNYKIFTDLQ